MQGRPLVYNPFSGYMYFTLKINETLRKQYPFAFHYHYILTPILITMKALVNKLKWLLLIKLHRRDGDVLLYEHTTCYMYVCR